MTNYYEQLVKRLRGTILDRDNFPRMGSEKWLPVVLAQEASDAIVQLQADLGAALEHVKDYKENSELFSKLLQKTEADLEAARALLRKAYIHVRYADTKPDAELERQIFDAALKDKP